MESLESKLTTNKVFKQMDQKNWENLACVAPVSILLIETSKKTNHVHRVAESVEIESKGIKDFADFYSCEVRSGGIINASSRPFGR